MRHYEAAIQEIPDRDGDNKKKTLYLAGRLTLDLRDLEPAEKHLSALAALDFTYKDVSKLLDKIAKLRENPDPEVSRKPPEKRAGQAGRRRRPRPVSSDTEDTPYPQTMPNIKSAKKRLKQSIVRNERNRSAKKVDPHPVQEGARSGEVGQRRAGRDRAPCRRRRRSTRPPPRRSSTSTPPPASSRASRPR